ncbi:hypothetical protein WJX73_005582 [Symbiochloris irregularis]|uniref:tRNA pseudouridine(55) synthase n=1 Tax=Symbiochloris irregularis TaxID=706552 RepID=A0AAW1NVW4_9CHLO
MLKHVTTRGCSLCCSRELHTANRLIYPASTRPRRALATAFLVQTEGPEQHAPQQLEQQKPAKKTKPRPPAPTIVTTATDVSDATLWDNAAILVDKPQDWTSMDVCGKLRNVLRYTLPLVNGKRKKLAVGHSGTLDPLATGLLIVGVGKGTKSVDSFQAQEKEYSGVLRLGQGTPSYDSALPVSEEAPWEHLTNDQLQEAARSFLGDIMQLPPMYSAVKIKGEELYKAARRGEEVERVRRPVSVSVFDLCRQQPGSQDVAYRIVCSKGTYVRALIHDLGQKVGSAAHVRTLRRDRIGAYLVKDAWPLHDLIERARAREAA